MSMRHIVAGLPYFCHNSRQSCARVGCAPGVLGTRVGCAPAARRSMWVGPGETRGRINFVCLNFATICARCAAVVARG